MYSLFYAAELSGFYVRLWSARKIACKGTQNFWYMQIFFCILHENGW